MVKISGKPASVTLLLLSILLAVSCTGRYFIQPEIGAALSHNQPNRVVSVYLLPGAGLNFRPTYIDRIITARLQTLESVVNAETVFEVHGVRTKIIGSSCEQLRRSYPDADQCTEVSREVSRLGDPVVSVATDSEGFAVLTLGEGVYQLSIQSWKTTEDEKCSWGGTTVLPEGSTSLELPIHVFCE